MLTSGGKRRLRSISPAFLARPESAGFSSVLPRRDHGASSPHRRGGSVAWRGPAVRKGRFPPAPRARTREGGVCGGVDFFASPRVGAGGEEYFSSGAFGRAERRGFAAGGEGRGGLSPRRRSRPRVFLAECDVHCDVLGTSPSRGLPSRRVQEPFPRRSRGGEHETLHNLNSTPPDPKQRPPPPPPPAALTGGSHHGLEHPRVVPAPWVRGLGSLSPLRWPRFPTGGWQLCLWGGGGGEGDGDFGGGEQGDTTLGIPSPAHPPNPPCWGRPWVPMAAPLPQPWDAPHTPHPVSPEGTQGGGSSSARGQPGPAALWGCARNGVGFFQALAMLPKIFRSRWWVGRGPSCPGTGAGGGEGLGGMWGAQIPPRLGGGFPARALLLGRVVGCWCWTRFHRGWSPIAVAVGPANKSQSPGPLGPPPRW